MLKRQAEKNLAERKAQPIPFKVGAGRSMIRRHPERTGRI
jgi:hypothetical protein